MHGLGGDRDPDGAAWPGTDAGAIAATVRSLGYGAEDPAAATASDAEQA